MTREDLKTGMIVECRNGEKGLIVKDNCCGTDALVFSENNWTGLNEFNNETLEWSPDKSNRTNYSKAVDIVRVYVPRLPSNFLNINMDNEFIEGYGGYNLVWKRKEVKEITLEEIRKVFGENIKIVY